jgi:hypothetical protein
MYFSLVYQGKNFNKTNLGTGGAAQVVEHVPGKLKALSSNPSIKKEKKKTQAIMFMINW